MRIQQFLEHHGIAKNPFAEEDAASDPVFKDHCIDASYHPTWDKVYGEPSEPSTSIVFGEKGAGKTAIRLQIARHLAEHSQKRPDSRAFVIHYDDFNPFLDRFRDHLPRSQRRPDRVLQQWKLWDHMDAILSLGVTGLVDRFLGVSQPSASVQCDLKPEDAKKLDRHQCRDLLLLAACYDQSTSSTFKGRWQSLRSVLRFSIWRSYREAAIGTVGTLVYLSIWFAWMYSQASTASLRYAWLHAIFAAIPWIPYLRRQWRCFWAARGVLKRMRVGNHETGTLRQTFMRFTPAELISQPLPSKEGTDDRYELLLKFQGILRSLGCPSLFVLVDRVDEPHLVNGSADLMKSLVWPMLDNKFLKHPGLGFKMMLPSELMHFVEREDRDFYQRSRLDKQNMIPSFEWTGEALYDVTNARLRACAAPGTTPSLRAFFAPNIADSRLIDALRTLRVPRRLFKFLYRLLVVHCNSHSDENPSWQIASETFESTLALCLRDQDAFDRGMGAG